MINYLIINTERHNFIDELTLYLYTNEPRFIHFGLNLTEFIDRSSKSDFFNEETQNIINDTLTIKDFIILGDKKFHEKIKTIEKKIKSNSFQYLNIWQIDDYLEQKKKVIGKKMVPYFYFLIIRFEEYKENFESILMLTFLTGITFLIFLFVENENDIKIHKNIIGFHLSTILVYSTEEILNYLSQKRNFSNVLELGDFLDIKFPKITLKPSDEDQCQDGCFELAETFDIDLIKNKILFGIGENIDFGSEFIKIYIIFIKFIML